MTIRNRLEDNTFSLLNCRGHDLQERRLQYNQHYESKRPSQLLSTLFTYWLVTHLKRIWICKLLLFLHTVEDRNVFFNINLTKELENASYKAVVMPVEVFVRGFEGSSVYNLLTKLSISGNKRTKALSYWWK